MSKKLDLTGQRFGRLTAIKYAGDRRWFFQCDCGNTKIINTYDVKCGKTKSCGCYMRENSVITNTTHNMRKTRLYAIYHSMKQRCYNPSSNSYKNYGARGIKICQEWLDDFMNFYNWAMENGYDENAPRGQCTIDRIDVNGNYCPENCRWADWDTQAMNKRKKQWEINGKSKSLKEWSQISGLPISTIRQRIKAGWDEKDILSVSKERENRIVNGTKLTYKGEIHNISEWSKILGIETNLIHERLRRGYTVEETFENKKGLNRNSAVILENVDTGEIKEFETQKELAEYIDIPLYSVNRYVLGKRKQPKGYKIYRKNL